MKLLALGGIGLLVMIVVIVMATRSSGGVKDKRDALAQAKIDPPQSIGTAVARAALTPLRGVATGKASWGGMPVPKPEWCFQPASWESFPDPVLGRIAVPTCVGLSNIIYLGVWSVPGGVGSAQAEVKDRVILHPATGLPDARYWTRCAR